MSGQSTTDSSSLTPSENSHKSSTNKALPSQTLAIFDWDDTLFCTKYLDIHKLDYTALFTSTQSLEDSHPYLCTELKELENTILNLFDQLLQKEIRIVIVSNADLRWIDNCLTHFLPDLHEFLEEEDIKIYSAKNIYSKTVCYEQWKRKCFRKVLKENCKERRVHLKVLSVGDSNEEKCAARELRGMISYEEIEVKFVEMVKMPSVVSLVRQLDYIGENHEEFFANERFLYRMGFDGKDMMNVKLEYDDEDNIREEIDLKLLRKKRGRTRDDVPEDDI